MAIDEAILVAYRMGIAPATLRTYGWNSGCVSLGCFQKVHEVLNAEYLQHPDNLFVRRMTAGEAFIHGEDISYSAVCSLNDLYCPSSIKQSYQTLGAFLINMYQSLGLQVAYAYQRHDDNMAQAQSAFCLAMRRDFDILVGKRKIGGNAQRRMKDSILQHGSIPLSINYNNASFVFNENVSALKEVTISLREALGNDNDIDMFQLSAMIKRAFEKTFSVSLTQGVLSSYEERLALQLYREKYNHAEWNYRYTQKAALAE